MGVWAGDRKVWGKNIFNLLMAQQRSFATDSVSTKICLSRRRYGCLHEDGGAVAVAVGRVLDREWPS